MVLDFLPNKILVALEKIDLKKIQEIRLRKGFPIICRSERNNKYLSKDGLSILSEDLIICEDQDIISIINHLTEHSVYAFNDKLKFGYLTASNGVRVGVAGECVFDDEKIVTIKNIHSLNIRIPNKINGCSDKIFPLLINRDEILNSLIISPPGFGKTTILKDLIIKLNNLKKYSIMVIDERAEFCDIKGENIDCIRYSNKKYAFSYAIRSMSPDILITDELTCYDDWKSVQDAVFSGVKVIASCHGSCIEQVVSKECFIKNVFDRYFILQSINRPGILKRVYDQKINLL